MSEKGCLISTSFNTLSVNNKVETKGLFSKEHTKASFHVQQDQTGNTTSDTKDIFNQLTYDGDNSDIPENTTITLGQKRIDFPSKSIIESLSIILKRDNYLVKNVTGGNTDVFVNISISNDKGASFVPLFDDTIDGKNIILLKGESSDDNQGSFLSINTIIPIISNYQLNTKEERIMAISTGGYVLNSTLMDSMGLSSIDDTSTDSNPAGFLYNDSNDTQYIDIQLSRSNSDKLHGANQGGIHRQINGIYNQIRDVDLHIGPESPPNTNIGAAFTVFAKFTTGIN